jgi:hypothetical protein
VVYLFPSQSVLPKIPTVSQEKLQIDEAGTKKRIGAAKLMISQRLASPASSRLATGRPKN